MNTAEYLLQKGDDAQPALMTPTACHTYGDLRRAVARVQAALEAAGVQPADRVGIAGRNSLFWAASYLAILNMGAVAAPLTAAMDSEGLSSLAQHLRCRAVCADRRAARQQARRLPDGVPVIGEEALERPGAPAWPRASFAVGDQDDAALMFTSGTTARPRAVRVTHRNIQANTHAIIGYLGLASHDRVLVVLPFHYCFGASLLHTHLRAGAGLVLASSFAYPEPALDLAQSASCTGLAGVPSVYQTLLRNSTFARRPLPNLRTVQQAGGRLPDALILELAAAVPQADVFIMYGQTEATARLSYLPPALLRTKLGSIGKGMPGVTLRVVDAAGQEAAPGETGEIIASGDNICAGYLDDPEATAQRFQNGILRTGDLATVDREGYITLAGRRDDFIKTMGYRVSSPQVEGCILELPEVVAAAAIGVPDAVRGEAIQVFAVLHSASRLTTHDILAHCGRRLPRHMQPSAIDVVAALPFNSHGKVDKNELRRLAGAEAS
jgi:acyl-CoA synthetase (AMP-forming)/AMP-acid ligase II